MTAKRPITPKGYNTLRSELQQLKALRPSLADAIERAREMGDLRENADYEEAKRSSGMVEAKIRDLDSKLASADIIQLSQISSSTKVVFGVTVTLEDFDSGNKKTYTIVGEDESDLNSGKISISSPIAKALIGKEIGNTATVQAPGGPREYEIIEIMISEELYREEVS